MRANGKIVDWDSASNSGYALAKAGGSRVFIEAKDFEDSGYKAVIGQQIKFEISEPKRGKPIGKSIQFVGPKIAKRKLPILGLVWGAIVTIAGLIGWLLISQALPKALIIYYGAVSVISFISYYIDKRAARKDLWRIRERTLQLWSMLGGWPGALLAQGMFRHKIRKLSFMVIFWGIVGLHLSLLFYYLTAEGEVLVRSFLINARFEILENGYLDFIQVWFWKLQRLLGI